MKDDMNEAEKERIQSEIEHQELYIKHKQESLDGLTLVVEGFDRLAKAFMCFKMAIDKSMKEPTEKEIAETELKIAKLKKDYERNNDNRL